MTSLKEKAMAYTPQKTHNVVELEKVPVNMDLKTKVVKEGTEDEFSYDYITVDGIEYRVPTSVLQQMKILINEEPETEYVSVSKSGTGLSTQYFVRSA